MSDQQPLQLRQLPATSYRRNPRKQSSPRRHPLFTQSNRPNRPNCSNRPNRNNRSNRSN